MIMPLGPPGSTIEGGSVVLGHLRCGEVVPFLPPEVVQAEGQGKLLGCGGEEGKGEGTVWESWEVREWDPRDC